MSERSQRSSWRFLSFSLSVSWPRLTLIGQDRRGILERCATYTNRVDFLVRTKLYYSGFSYKHMQ